MAEAGRDIDAYNCAVDYEHFQNLRPDYTGAIRCMLDFSAQALAGKSDVRIADLCCGTGANTKSLCERVSNISRATLVDILPEFVVKAHQSGIRTKLDLRISDVLDVELLPRSYDLANLTFAWHHVPDMYKEKLLGIAANCIKPDGAVVLTEIYLPTPQDNIRYYTELYAAIGIDNPGLKNFLDQTARSHDFEFKVSKEFAARAIAAAGFSIVEEIRIWPMDVHTSVTASGNASVGSMSAPHTSMHMQNTRVAIPRDQGTFVQVLKPRR